MSGSARRSGYQYRQGGFAMMAPMVLMLALVVAATSSFPAILRSIEGERDSALAASQIKQIGVAVKSYVLSNTTALQGSATETVPHEIVFSDLINAGLLPTGYNPINPWGQRYRIFAFLDSGAGTTALKVLTIAEGGAPGGAAQRTDLSDSEKRLVNKTIPATAASVGVSGGFMPSAAYPGAASGVIMGANGIWTFDVGGLLPFSPTQGALANLQYFTAGTLDNDYLYRVAVPGRPELNRMTTSLDMDGNDISGVESLTDMTGYLHTTGEQLTANGDVIEADTGNITLHDGLLASGDVVIDDVQVQGSAVPVSRALFDVRTVNPNALIEKPSCPTGASAQIFASVGAMPLSASNGIATTSGLVSGELRASRTRAVDAGGSWRIYLEANVDGTWYRLADSEGKMVVAPKCT